MGLLAHAKNTVLHVVRDRLTGGKRSSQWPAVERQHRDTYPNCAVCGSPFRVQVHHKKPFHLHPELELDPANLVTLCMTSSNECHLRIGHSGDFKAYNAALDQCLKLASAGTNVLVLADIAKKSKQYL